MTNKLSHILDEVGAEVYEQLSRKAGSNFLYVTATDGVRGTRKDYIRAEIIRLYEARKQLNRDEVL